MSARWATIVTNVFFVAFALDGCVSVVDEILRATADTTALGTLRIVVALGVLYASVLLFPVMALTPRLRVSVILPLALGNLWLNFGAAPLPLLFASGAALGVASSSLQVGLALLMALWIRRCNGGDGWLLRTAPTDAGPFSLAHTLRFAAGCVFGLPPLALAYTAVLIVTWLEVGTQGFIDVDLVGVSLGDRRYVRDDREIRLVGMMHVGEGDAYRDLVSSFASPSTVILAEGVSDRRAVFDGSLSYGRAAEALGLEPQGDLDTYLDETLTEAENELRPHVRHADLDMSDFDPATIEALEWAAQLWNSGSVAEALRMISEGDPEDFAAWDTVERDIIGRRNVHLLGEIEAALADYERIIVPWGALHLPFIEQEILRRGFARVERRERRLISWPTVLVALF